jgi:hypothetical protein
MFPEKASAHRHVHHIVFHHFNDLIGIAFINFDADIRVVLAELGHIFGLKAPGRIGDRADAQRPSHALIQIAQGLLGACERATMLLADL